MLQVFYVFILTLAALGTSHAQEAVAATAGGSQSTELRTTVQVQALTGIIEALGNELARVEDELQKVRVCNVNGFFHDPTHSLADANGCVAKLYETIASQYKSNHRAGTSCTGWNSNAGGAQNNTCTDTLAGKVNDPSSDIEVIIDFLAIRRSSDGGNYDFCTASASFTPGETETKTLRCDYSASSSVENDVTVSEDGVVTMHPFSFTAPRSAKTLGMHRYLNYRSKTIRARAMLSSDPVTGEVVVPLSEPDPEYAPLNHTHGSSNGGGSNGLGSGEGP